jgi:hypothetical protein
MRSGFVSRLRLKPVRAGRSRSWRFEEALELRFELDQALERLQEVAESSRGQHDRVTPSPYVLRYLQKAPALIFLQVEEEQFPVDRDLFRGDRFGRLSVPRVGVHHIEAVMFTDAPRVGC